MNSQVNNSINGWFEIERKLVKTPMVGTNLHELVAALMFIIDHTVPIDIGSLRYPCKIAVKVRSGSGF